MVNYKGGLLIFIISCWCPLQLTVSLLLLRDVKSAALLEMAPTAISPFTALIFFQLQPTDDLVNNNQLQASILIILP